MLAGRLIAAAARFLLGRLCCPPDGLTARATVAIGIGLIVGASELGRWSRSVPVFGTCHESLSCAKIGSENIVRRSRTQETLVINDSAPTAGSWGPFRVLPFRPQSIDHLPCPLHPARAAAPPYGGGCCRLAVAALALVYAVRRYSIPCASARDGANPLGASARVGGMAVLNCSTDTLAMYYVFRGFGGSLRFELYTIRAATYTLAVINYHAGQLGIIGFLRAQPGSRCRGPARSFFSSSGLGRAAHDLRDLWRRGGRR